MSRTLFNIYRTDTVRASTAGFLNWLCDSNSSVQKGTDHVDGGNFDTDLTNTINGTYGFSRVTRPHPRGRHHDSGRQRGRRWRRCDVRCAPLHCRRWDHGRQHDGHPLGSTSVHGRRRLAGAGCGGIECVDSFGRHDRLHQRDHHHADRGTSDERDADRPDSDIAVLPGQGSDPADQHLGELSRSNNPTLGPGPPAQA